MKPYLITPLLAVLTFGAAEAQQVSALPPAGAIPDAPSTARAKKIARPHNYLAPKFTGPGPGLPTHPWPENRPVAPAYPPKNSNPAYPVQPAMCVLPDGTLCQTSYTVQWGKPIAE